MSYVAAVHVLTKIRYTTLDFLIEILLFSKDEFIWTEVMVKSKAFYNVTEDFYFRFVLLKFLFIKKSSTKIKVKCVKISVKNIVMGNQTNKKNW